MAEHTIYAEMPSVEIINKDLMIEVRADGELLSRLTVSRGSLGWFSHRDQQERHLT